MHRYLAVILLLGVSCARSDPLDTPLEDVTASAIAAAEAAADEVAARKPWEHKVRIQRDEHAVDYYRGDRLILRQSGSHPSAYHLFVGDRVVANVVVDKPYSPQVVISQGSPVHVELHVVEDGRLQLSVLGTESVYSEAYWLSTERVEPVSAEVYLDLLGVAEASDAFFKELGESMYREAGMDAKIGSD